MSRRHRTHILLCTSATLSRPRRNVRVGQPVILSINVALPFSLFNPTSPPRTKRGAAWHSHAHALNFWFFCPTSNTHLRFLTGISMTHINTFSCGTISSAHACVLMRWTNVYPKQRMTSRKHASWIPNMLQAHGRGSSGVDTMLPRTSTSTHTHICHAQGVCVRVCARVCGTHLRHRSDVVPAGRA